MTEQLQQQVVTALQQMNNPDASLRKPAEEFLRANEQVRQHTGCSVFT